jgi:hypothetical protein
MGQGEMAMIYLFFKIYAELKSLRLEFKSNDLYRRALIEQALKLKIAEIVRFEVQSPGSLSIFYRLGDVASL